jgi:hypothetical protein
MPKQRRPALSATLLFVDPLVEIELEVSLGVLVVRLTPRCRESHQPDSSRNHCWCRVVRGTTAANPRGNQG